MMDHSVNKGGMLPEEGEEPASLEQRIAHERDEIWERAQKDPRWKELCSTGVMQDFFTILPQWFVKWGRLTHEIPQVIARSIETDYKRNKTSVDLPANTEHRFGQSSIDFTVGKYGQITIHPLTTHTKWHNKGFPPPGAYMLDRQQRDVSGKYFEAVIMYFKALLRYLSRDHTLKEDPPEERGALALEVKQLREACQDAFRQLHLNYASLLLNYKFASSRHERAFFEFIYRATRKMLRHFFNCEGRVERLPINSLKLRTAIEDMFNKMFRSNSFRFDYKRQQADWEALAGYLHQSDWGEDEKGEGYDEVGGESPLGGVSPRSVRSTTTARTGDFVERKFTQLVCPPTRISLSRAMQNRSMMVTCRYPDIKTTMDLLSERQHRPGVNKRRNKPRKRMTSPEDGAPVQASLGGTRGSTGAGGTGTALSESPSPSPARRRSEAGVHDTLSSTEAGMPHAAERMNRPNRASTASASRRPTSHDPAPFSAIPHTSATPPPTGATRASGRPLWATSKSSTGGAAGKYIPKRRPPPRDDPIARHRKVENRLMPHNQMEDVSIPHDVLGELFKDQQLW